MSKHAVGWQSDGPTPDLDDPESRGSTDDIVVTPTEPLVPMTTGRSVSCPECGAVATITVNRRESHDFCAACDFPLFWTPNQVVIGDADLQAHAALRRLPGTAGRTTVGNLSCPHCAEANPLSGVLCLRCSGDLRPVAAVPVAPPEPEPVPEPVAEPTGISSWWWVLGGATLALLIVVVVSLVRGY